MPHILKDHSATPPRCDRDSGHDPRIVLALQLLENEVGLRVDQAARKVNLSGSRLRHLLREELGIPPHLYVKQRRLFRARELLQKTFLSVGEGWIGTVRVLLLAPHVRNALRGKRYGQVFACQANGAQLPVPCRAVLHSRHGTTRNGWVRALCAVPNEQDDRCCPYDYTASPVRPPRPSGGEWFAVHSVPTLGLGISISCRLGRVTHFETQVVDCSSVVTGRS
jgi:hypothetical protein